MTNPPPVAPVVTEKMIAAAEDAYDILAARDDVPYSYSVPMRAAITAALEASGELERLRAALKAVIDAHETGRFEPLQAAIEAAKFRTALQGDAP